MIIEAYDALGNIILKGDTIRRVYDGVMSHYKVIELLPKNMIRCGVDNEEERFVFVGEGVTKI
jgi:hypothetical protein